MRTEVQQIREMEVLRIQGENLSLLIEAFQVASTSHKEKNYPLGLVE